MDWKIKRDHFYSDLEHKGKEWLDNAGYFDDECDYDFNIEESLNIMCTPLEYVRANLHKPNPAIIITTGSFNPMHNGHLEMMSKAKEAVEESGYSCIGGFISPDHDHYMKLKLGDAALPIHKRIKIISDFLKEEEWLNVDPWAGVFHITSINFTDIIYRLKLYIKEYLDVEIPIFFVCGGDNARFANTFSEKGHCVIVSRPPYEEFQLDLCPNYKNILFAYNDNSQSSTEVRKTFVAPVTKRHVVLRVNDNYGEVMKFTDLIKENFASCKLVHVKEQIVTFNKFFHYTPSLSLDPFIESDYNIGVSRLYDAFGVRKLGYTKRPHCNSWIFETSKLHARNITEIDLFDDDIDTGGTMDYIEEFLKTKNIKVISRISLSKSNDTREVIDARDFIYGSNQGGLVTKSPDGKSRRVPYIYPFVCPYIRASIENPMEFSKKIWKANIDFYERKGDWDKVEQCKYYLEMIELF